MWFHHSAEEQSQSSASLTERRQTQWTSGCCSFTSTCCPSLTWAVWSSSMGRGRSNELFVSHEPCRYELQKSLQQKAVTLYATSFAFNNQKWLWNLSISVIWITLIYQKHVWYMIIQMLTYILPDKKMLRLSKADKNTEARYRANELRSPVTSCPSHHLQLPVNHLISDWQRQSQLWVLRKTPLTIYTSEYSFWSPHKQ